MLELNFVRLPFDTSVLLLSEQQNIETPGMELVRLRVNTSDSLTRMDSKMLKRWKLEMDSVYSISQPWIKRRKLWRYCFTQLPIGVEVPEIPPSPYESIDNSVVFPNKLQNVETLEMQTQFGLPSL